MQDCLAIEAIPEISPKWPFGTLRTTPVGRIGLWEYHLRIRSASSGRRIVYSELVEERFGSSMGFGDARERYLATLRLQLTADARLKRIKAALPPYVRTDIIGPDKKPLDSEAYEKMHRDAARYGITPIED